MNNEPEKIKFIRDRQTLAKSISACVVIPPVFDFYFTRHRFSGLGAEVVRKLLIQNDCDVRFFNFPILSKKGARESLPAEFDFLTPHITENETGKLSFFTRYQRFGPSFSQCAAEVVQAAPELVFISCFAFCYASPALELAGRIHALDPRIVIIMGGAGVSAYPEFFIKHPHVDFVITGEAEISIPAFVRAVKSGAGDFSMVPNLFYKTGNKVIAPILIKRTTAQEIAFVLKKTGETKKSIYYTTSLSRGCPKKCRFCSNFLCHGREFRKVPVNTVKQELSLILSSQNEVGKTVHVNFEDDNLLLDPDYFLNILDIFKSRFFDICFSAENGMDYTMLTPDLVKTLISYGVKQFNLSVASVDGDILKSENRNSRFSRYEEIVKILDQHHISCITYYICGFKKDTKETVVETIAWLAAHPTLLGISLFYPVPGIPDYDDSGFFDTVVPGLCAGSSAFPWNGSLSTGELVTAFRLSRFVNLLKSDSVSEIEASLINRSFKEQRLFTFIKENRRNSIVPVLNADDEMVKLFFNTVKNLPLNPCAV